MTFEYEMTFEDEAILTVAIFQLCLARQVTAQLINSGNKIFLLCHYLRQYSK